MQRALTGYSSLGVVVLLLVGLSALARAQDAPAAPPLSPPAQLIDLGGWPDHSTQRRSSWERGADSGDWPNEDGK